VGSVVVAGGVVAVLPLVFLAFQLAQALPLLLMLTT
jgi:hypothetical protein